MNVKYKLNLDVYKDRNYESIIVAQNDDKSRIIECKLYADSQPIVLSSSVTAAFNATVDNVIVAENVPCIVADNVVKITLAKSMLQLAGMMKCELVLSENDTILTSQHFSVFVNKSVINTKSKYEPAGSNLATKKDVNSAIKTASAKMIEKDSLLNTSTSINLTSLEDTEQTANGVTISVSNNKITLSGTSTAAVNFYLKLKRAVTLEQGKAYCLSLQNFANITNSGCVFYPANSQTVISSSWLLSEVSAFKNAAATYTATENVVVNSIKIAVAANRLIDNSCNLQLEQNNKKSAYANPDFISESIKPELYQTPDYTMHYLYVSNDYNESTEGFGVTKFNSILSANDSITDNNYHNRYTIIVAQGTYTDMQDRYAGLSDVGLVGYRGVMMKDYVYYESENIYNPSATIIKWDGATGFDKSALKSEDIIKKCPFHLDLNVHTHIKGFTFDCKNIRYALHLESGGTGYATDWVVSNCVFKWGGRADCVDYIGKTTVPVFGCGHSFGENGLIENCKIIVENCTVGYQSHENADKSSFGLALKTGANITIRNCDFGGTEIQARTLKGAYSDTPNVLTVDRCVNISDVKKLYAAPATKCDWTVVENLRQG
nr:MAG TPA: BppU domain protein [Caudoviricetes sp.]